MSSTRSSAALSEMASRMGSRAQEMEAQTGNFRAFEAKHFLRATMASMLMAIAIWRISALGLTALERTGAAEAIEPLLLSCAAAMEGGIVGHANEYNTTTEVRGAILRPLESKFCCNYGMRKGAPSVGPTRGCCRRPH